jgi:WD40 repeat protein
LFTGALLEGMTEERSEQGEVTVLSVLRYVNEAFKRLQLQEPIYIGAGKDIPLIRYGQRVVESVSEENPYQGLMAFTPQTAKFFFGRDRVVDDLVRALQGASFVPLIGASGSGKSSVVRAGLVPRLEALGWRVLEPMKPGVEPIYELKRSFEPLFKRGELAEVYACIEAEGLRGIVDRLPEQKYLLVIDQFEEVFTLSSDRVKQRRFIELLMGLEADGRLTIVTTMRSDFLEAWQGHGDLVAVAQENMVLMPPLEGLDLRAAIVEPAKVQGYTFEVGLEQLILAHMAEESNALPLLEFALQELWKQRDQKRDCLTVAAYEVMGGLMGALNRYATNWYEMLTEMEQGWVRRVMLELVRVGMEEKDTRQRRKQVDLLALGDGKTLEVLDLLIEQRLLVQEKEEIDLAHERLMDGWELFFAWRQVDRDLRRLRQRVEDSEQEWRNKGQNNDYLIQGGLLSEIREQLDNLSLRPAVRKFYNLSEASYQEKIVVLETALAESQLREQAMRVLNLLPAQPHQAAVETIQAIGNSLDRLQKRVLLPVQSNLRDVIEKVRESHRLKGHSASILSVVFSPDGQIIASGSEDGTIRLWNLDGNSIRPPFQYHAGWVFSVAFSPDGQLIASGSSDKTIRLWDLDGNPIGKPFEGHSASVRSVAFSPDGQTIVSGSDDRTIRLWDLDGNPVGVPFQGHRNSILSVAFSPDGQVIASGSADETIRLWDLNCNFIGVKSLQGHRNLVWSVAFSPDGQTIASGSADETIRLWDLNGNPVGRAFAGHRHSVLSVAFSPDGQTIASGSTDETIRVWDLGGNLIGIPFQGHRHSVLSVAFSPDKQTIVSGSDDATIRLWDLADNLIEQVFQGHRDWVFSVAFSPDGQTIVSGSDDTTICLWDLDGNLIGKPFQGHTASVRSVAFAIDGQTIASGSDDKTIRLWDLEGNPIGQPFQGHSGWVLSVAFSPDGKTIISGSADKTICLWDLEGNLIGQPFQGHCESVSSVAFSPDGKTIISGSEDKTICLWDLEGNLIGQPFQGHCDSVFSVAFSPDGQAIVSGSADETIRLWDLEGNPIGQSFQGIRDSIFSVAFSPDGQTIVSGSSDQTIRLWDLEGNPIGQPFQGHNASVFSVAFSPDGKTIISGSADHSIRLWLGGTWQDWLRICCDRFRYHPSFTDPNNPAAVEACEVCRKYVWEKE